MIKHYCDICGKRLKDFDVIHDTDPLDYRYEDCGIIFNIGLQGIYEVGFDEICHECEKRIANIDIDDFHEALKKLMGLYPPIEKEGAE